MRFRKVESWFGRGRRKGSESRPRLSRIELLESRLALHEGESAGHWHDHMLDDDAIFDATAANPPTTSSVLAAPAVAGAPVDIGQWSTLQNWPINFINAVMLPTGKVLGYDRTLSLRLWDPATNSFTSPASPGYNIFCSGTALLADGRVLVTGGHVVDVVGLPYAAIYDPFADSWTQLDNMNAGRWYPSTTTLANGDALVLSGGTNGTFSDPLPQVYDSATGTWRDLTGATQTLPFYPRTFSAPNGDAFVAGPQQFTEYLDTSGIGQIIPVANRITPNRGYGQAVMYAPGKILYVGGGSPATASAEVIDLNQATPTWRLVAPMAFARRNGGATLLPSGEVLVTGGNTGSGTYDGAAILAAEIWNPTTETFRTVADMSDIRWYHSVALLLPDGRVLSTGGDLHLTGQLYSPSYLFEGARPTISSAPGTVQYGDNIFVGTPDAASITNVRWIRMGSATHAQDWDQYIEETTFTQAAGGLNVAAPPSPNSMPPGYYMMFLVKGNVPSVAQIIKVGTTLPTVSIAGTSATEGPTGSTVNAVFTVSLSEASSKPITVAYATTDGAALAGQDYTAAAGTLTFAPLVTQQTITVPITGDGVADPDELFVVNLSTPVNATLGVAQSQGLIRDFNSLPVLEILGTSLVEGDAGTKNASFVVRLSTPPTVAPVTVAYTTANGTATAPADFTATNGTLTFNPGVTQQTILVPVAGDTTDEINETFLVNLQNPAGATIEVGQAQALIYNDDAPPTANLAATATVTEPTSGTANMPVVATLSAPSGKTVVIPWTTGGDGTAVGGRNYQDQVGQVTFLPGVTSQTFNVAVQGDGVKTPNLTFAVKMQSELLNANYGVRYTSATITNVDAVPSISLSNATITEGNTGTISAVFTATLSAPMAQAVTVAYATSAGTATATTDYTQTAGIVTFAANTTTKTITVLVIGDTTVESNETFNLTLSNPAGATLAAGKAVGTIVDNDGGPVPAAPTNLAGVAGFGLVALSWTASAGTTNYRVYRGTTPNGQGTTPVATGVAGTNFVDTGLVNGATYYYRVTAVNQATTAYEGSASAEFAIAPTAYNFSNGFPGKSLDPTVSNAAGSSSVLSLNGLNVENVRLAGETLQLTDGGTNQTDSVFTRNAVNITRFTTQFSFQQLPSYLYTAGLADGMTFTIQGVGPTAMGISGGGLGYAGIATSVAVKFDLFDGGNGDGPNSTGLYTNGAFPEGVNSVNLTGTGVDLHSGHSFNVSMVYDGTTLQVTITDTVTLAIATQSYTVNIPAIVGANTAFVGFTAGTGALSAVQKIQSWVFTPAPTAPANLIVGSTSTTQINLAWTNTDPNATGVLIERKTGAAGTYAQIGTTFGGAANTFADTTVAASTTYVYRVRSTNNGSTSIYSNEVTATTNTVTTPTLNYPNGFAGAAAQFMFNGVSAKIVGSNLQLTDGGATEKASIFALNRVDVTKFTTQFNLQLLGGTTPTADGMTFTIQGVANTRVGGAGGGLGYAGIGKSVAVKFDLFSNAGEGPNSTGLYTNGAQPNAVNSVNLTGTGIDLHSGHVFKVNMTYDGTTLQVTITDTTTLAAATQSYTVNIPGIVGGNTAFVGFTGGTGGLTAVQNILNWTYTVTSGAAPAAVATALAAPSSNPQSTPTSSVVPQTATASAQTSSGGDTGGSVTLLTPSDVRFSRAARKPRTLPISD